MKTTKTLQRLGRQLLGEQRGRILFPSAARATHCYVIGQPGMGKTKFIEAMVLQDILAGRGVGVIDVHGDLYHHLLCRLAQLAVRNPALARRLVIIDPCQPDYTVSFNPLATIAGIPRERVALFMTDVVVKIWNVNTTESPRMVWLLTNAFLALIDLQLSLLDLPRWLQDKAWRKELVPQLSHDGVRSYWAHEFPTSPKEIQVWITPALNKLGGLLFDPAIRRMLTGTSKFSFRQVMDEQLILLVHIPKGVIGEASSAMLGAFIVAQLQKAALSRADVDERPTFHLFVDEFQNYVTAYIQDVLAESRKYGLALTMAHQFLAQLGDDLRSAVLNTSGTIVCFRVGYHDARTLAPEIFPTPDFPAGDATLEHKGWEGLALSLANLDRRQFWVRRRGVYAPVRKRSLDLADPIITPELTCAVQQLMATAGETFGYKNSPSLATQADLGEEGETGVALQPPADFATLTVNDLAQGQVTSTDGGEDENELWN